MREPRTHAGASAPRSLLQRLVPFVVAVSIASAAIAVVMSAVHAGHELSFYPSFYPQEIAIETVAPSVAATRLADSSLHAYAGADPFAGGSPPKDVATVTSLGAYVVVNVDPAAVPERSARCTLAADVRARLAVHARDFVFHPYPVTPYHGDYLGHVDQADAAGKTLARGAADRARANVRLAARGPIAEKLVAALGSTETAAAGVTIEQVDLATLLSEHRIETNGWLGPPWLKHGWYQAYALEARAVSDAETKRTVETLYRRRISGAYDSAAARIDLERKLVAALGSGCERVVAGYTLAREHTSAEYSQGVENVAWDAQLGLASAIFVRTVKLKDFPWNGWLRVGTATAPEAAWNPIGGFTDPAGRLIWATLGDPAFIPAPRSGSWLPNRTTANVEPRGTDGVAVPADAIRPAPGTGMFAPVGAGKRARTKLVYRVREGAFHDGTRMTVPDVLYALSLASRWGARPDVGDGPAPDAGVAAATALLRERLVGLRVTKIETVVKKYSDVEFVYSVPIVELYVDHAAIDAAEIAALAPPWSVVPWHVAALMEEAVARGLGAFSREEASRRGVPWLDVVRDAKVREALARILDTWEAHSYVPPALAKDVTPSDARARWSALKRFRQTYGHILVTNGPYRLDKWSETRVVLGVFRDLTYPIGVGTFDEYAIPIRAFVTKLADRGDRLEFNADVERVSKFARSYEIVREPLGPEQPGVHEHVPTARYVVIAADGSVARAGHASHNPQRRFRVDLKGLRAGAYTVAIGFEADGNAVDMPITRVEHRVAGGDTLNRMKR